MIDIKISYFKFYDWCKQNFLTKRHLVRAIGPRLLLLTTLLTSIQMTFYIFIINYYTQNQVRTITQFLIPCGFIFINSLFTLFILKLKSINEQKHRQQYLEKQNLLRVIVHDLSNPLTLILSYAQLLKRDLKADSKKNQQITHVESAAQEICLILSTVKELEAYSSGKKQLKFEKFNLSHLLQRTEKNFQKQFQEKSLQLHIQCDSDIEIKANRVIFENQILNNLISNAIKFSLEKSSIEIIATRMGHSQIKLSITDYGIGIPEKMQKILFDPLASTTRPGTLGESGTGFGLPIAMKFCKLMKIQLLLNSIATEESNIKHGTTFDLIFESNLTVRV